MLNTAATTFIQTQGEREGDRGIVLLISSVLACRSLKTVLNKPALLWS